MSTYRYLNAGPGNVGAIFINSEIQNKLTPGLRGWFGVDRKKIWKQEKSF